MSCYTHAQILVVSPEADSGRFLVQILEAAGYLCTLAQGYEDAVEEIRRCQPALVICEHRPPELDAVAFLGELRRACPEMARVFITGDSAPRLFERAKREADVHYYLTLPFAPDHLVEVIRALLFGQTVQRACTRQVAP